MEFDIVERRHHYEASMEFDIVELGNEDADGNGIRRSMEFDIVETGNAITRS